MREPVFNLHNHTPFSDGAYTIDELCEAHLARDDVKVVGIGVADHLFCTPSSREVSSERDFERLFGAETREYVAMVNQARERWEGKLQIFCGAGINWQMNKNMLGSIRPMLDGIDYVLCESVDWAGLTQLANQARRWPCPVGLAHTNVATQFPNTSMDQIVRTLANARLFFEVGSHLLPLEERDPWFDILPNHRVSVCIGTNTHDDLSCLDDLGELHAYVQRRGLAEKLFLPQVLEKQALTA